MNNRIAYLWRNYSLSTLSKKLVARFFRIASVRAESIWAKYFIRMPNRRTISATMARGQFDEFAYSSRDFYGFDDKLPNEETDVSIRQFYAWCESEFEELSKGKIRGPGGHLRSIGASPDWHQDPITGSRWPKTFWKLLGENDDRLDILELWWRGSFYHLLPAAVVAARGKQEEAIAAGELIQTHLGSFIDENPIGFGVHWKSTTIVSLRMIHLIWVQQILLRATKRLSDKLFDDLSKLIFAHRQHIARNPEWFHVRTNHYITNVFALLLFNCVYSEFESVERRTKLLEILKNEVFHHFNEDGATHEGSVNYHRFALEIFLHTKILADKIDFELGEPFRVRLIKATDFLRNAVRPDGTLIKVGDAADIRLVNLLPIESIDKPHEVLGLASRLLNHGELVTKTGRGVLSLLLLDKNIVLEGDIGRSEYSQTGIYSYPDGGFTFARWQSSDQEANSFFFFRAGPLALQGVSGHGHHDQLSFELWVDGSPIFVDSGWFRYEGAPIEAAYLRSSMSHNTAYIDNRSQIAKDLFMYPPPQRPVPILVRAEFDERICVEGRHQLYFDLIDPVTHNRKIEINTTRLSMVVTDQFEAENKHTVCWNYTLAPECRAEQFADNSVLIHQGKTGHRYCLEAMNSLHVDSIEAAYISDRYADKIDVQRIRFLRDISSRSEQVFRLTRME